jgi:hypothetical protein
MSMNLSLEKIIMMGQREPEKQEVRMDDETAIIRLKDHFKDWSRKHAFKPGDLVRIKPGLNLFKWPEVNETCIVLDVLDPPLESQAGPHAGRYLSLRIGCFVPDGTFIVALHDPSFFDLYEPSA